MENFTYLSCNDFPWQASSPCMSLNIRDKLRSAIQAPGVTHQREPKKLTEEAFFMICVILVSVGLALLGSSITFYESFIKEDEKKSRNSKKLHYANSTKATKGRIEDKDSSESVGFFEACKSFLKCFCMISNGRKIFDTVTTEGLIDCFHGLRVLSNILVITLHTQLLPSRFVRNFDDLKPVLEWKITSFLLNVQTLLIDIFFVISGFLNARDFFNKYRSGDKNISWFYFYFKRYVRLTPVLMIVLGFNATLFTYTGTGILWPTYATNPICQEDWWWHLLYINNFKESEKQCMIWCWSLAVDMQLYVISPLFMVSLIRWPWLGYALIFACISGSCIISFVLTYHFDLIDSFSRMHFYFDDYKLIQNKQWEYFDVLYKNYYTRIVPYLVAILLAYYLHKKVYKKGSLRNSAIALSCGWIITAIFMLICFFPFQNTGEYILMVKAFYNGTKHLLFSCSLAWIIYLCLTGQIEFLNRILSWKLFRPLSRLSYCSYMINSIVVIRLSLQIQEFTDLNSITMMRLYLHVFCVTYFFSFFASMLFEMPVLNLLRWFGEKKMRKNLKLTHFE